MEKQKTKAERVHACMMACLYKPEEVGETASPPEGAVTGDGIVHKYAFHPGRLAEQKPEIAAILAEMPDEFMAGRGGGWSFLNLAVDRNGEHWAEHPTLGALCALGDAAGLLKFPLPREMWGSLPGGMPYVVIDLTPTPETPDARG